MFVVVDVPASAQLDGAVVELYVRDAVVQHSRAGGTVNGNSACGMGALTGGREHEAWQPLRVVW